jgi:hypothetical protein
MKDVCDIASSHCIRALINTKRGWHVIPTVVNTWLFSFPFVISCQRHTMKSVTTHDGENLVV